MQIIKNSERKVLRNARIIAFGFKSDLTNMQIAKKFNIKLHY